MDGAEPAATLATARGLVESAVGEAAAARQVGWESAAAERFRTELTLLTRLLAGRLDVLDEALRLLRGSS